MAATPTSNTSTPPSPTAPDALLSDPRLTAAGLLFEAADGLRNALVPSLGNLGLGGAEVDVLIRLARSPQHRLRMADLADQVALSASGLTRLVDRLTRAGLVRRENCPEDRRGWYAVATPEGLAKISENLPSHLTAIHDAFTGLFDERELADLLKSLRRLRDVVRPGAAAGAAPGPNDNSEPTQQ